MMTTIPLENKSEATLRIMLEPWAKEFDVASGEQIVISGDLSDLKIDYWEENFVSLWVKSDVVILKNGVQLSPIPIEE